MNDLGIWIDDRKSFYGSCKKEAEAAYETYMERKKAGHTLNSDCLGKLIDQYIEHILSSSNLASSTKNQYIRAYERFFKRSELAGRLPHEVTAMDLQHFYDTSDAPVAALKNLHYLLRRFYRYTDLHGLCRDITGSLTPANKPREPQSDDSTAIDVWSDDDIRKLLSALTEHRLRLLVVLAINTGCRIGELLALSYNDIEEDILRLSHQLSEAPKADGPGKDPILTN